MEQMTAGTDDVLQEMISRCNRCGFCQDVCPTYAVTRNEFDVARGRVRMMRLIREGQHEPDRFHDKALLKQVDQCLLCGACVANCPSQVPTDRIMRLAREEILEQKGFSLFHRLLYRGVLTRQERLEKVSGLVRLLDRTDLRNQVAKTSAVRASDFLSHALSYLPSALEIPVRHRISSRNHEKGTPRVSYFLGCGTDVFTPRAALASLDCLEKMGFSVSIPRVCCCGGPHFSAGDIRKARSLARENIRSLTAENPEVIVTDCATCAHTLHDYASFFPADDPIQATVADVSAKVVDISTFVLDHLGKGSVFPASVPGKAKVTYHDPCHAVRGLGGTQPPREIMRAIPGIKRVEMDHADACCGGAGSYTFRHPEMSRKILDAKINAIVKTGAAVVATACPSCILQLGAGLRRRGLGIPVVHVMELLSRSLGDKSIHGRDE